MSLDNLMNLHDKLDDRAFTPLSAMVEDAQKTIDDDIKKDDGFITFGEGTQTQRIPLSVAYAMIGIGYEKMKAEEKERAL